MYNWKPILKSDDYFINEIGVVISKKFGKKHILKQSISNSGHFFVKLKINDVTKNYLVHRLVAEAFIQNPKGLPCVIHKDGNKLNNSVGNLEYCDRSSLVINSFKNGRSVRVKGYKSHLYGKCNPNAKSVINLETGIFYDTITFAAKAYNIDREKLTDMLSGRRRNKTSFKYAN